MDTQISSDRIEKRLLLRASPDQVWTRAFADAGAFGRWFGVDMAGAFQPGAQLSGRITYEGFEHLTMEIAIQEVEPGRRLAWRWHPAAIDPAVDYSAEPTTLVVFELAEVEGGTLLTLVESGFDALPPNRRGEAYRGNEGGWTEQMRNLERHVGEAA